jgi:hypothetical protein
MTKERIVCGKYATGWRFDVSFATLSVSPELHDGKEPAARLPFAFLARPNGLRCYTVS